MEILGWRPKHKENTKGNRCLKGGEDLFDVFRVRSPRCGNFLIGPTCGFFWLRKNYNKVLFVIDAFKTLLSKEIGDEKLSITVLVYTSTLEWSKIGGASPPSLPGVNYHW